MSGHPPPDALSITALAKEIGVSKQAVHRRVSAMVAAKQIVTYPGPNRSVLVSKSAYVFAVAQHGDPAREASVATTSLLTLAATPAAPSAEPEAETGPGYRDAKARDAYYSAEMKRLAYQRESGQLYTMTEVTSALQRIATAVSTQARSFVAHADAGSEAHEAGMPAFRRWLAGMGDDLCRTLACEFRIIASEAETPAAPPQPADDEPPDQEP